MRYLSNITSRIPRLKGLLRNRSVFPWEMSALSFSFIPSPLSWIGTAARSVRTLARLWKSQTAPNHPQILARAAANLVLLSVSAPKRRHMCGVCVCTHTRTRPSLPQVSIRLITKYPVVPSALDVMVLLHWETTLYSKHLLTALSTDLHQIFRKKCPHVFDRTRLHSSEVLVELL